MANSNKANIASPHWPYLSPNLNVCNGWKADIRKQPAAAYVRGMTSTMKMKNQYVVFTATKRALAENLGAEVVDAEYDEEAFGNFWVSFRFGGRNGSIVMDRLQLFICDAPRGEGRCKMLFQDMRPIGEEELVSILVSLFSSGRW